MILDQSERDLYFTVYTKWSKVQLSLSLLTGQRGQEGFPLSKEHPDRLSGRTLQGVS